MLHTNAPASLARGFTRRPRSRNLVLKASVGHQPLGMQAFSVCHTFEDDLTPDADRELDRFFFEDLSETKRMKMFSAKVRKVGPMQSMR